MRFVNEIAIFSTILWYTKDILRYYGNLFIEQRKGLLVFLPKERHEKGLIAQEAQQPTDSGFEMSLKNFNYDNSELNTNSNKTNTDNKTNNTYNSNKTNTDKTNTNTKKMSEIEFN